MGTLTFIILLIGASVAMFAIGPKLHRSVRTFAFVPVVLAVVVAVASTFQVVDGGTVGVQQTFGKYANETLGAGAHLVAPWTNVTSVDIRTNEYTMASRSTEGAVSGDDSITITASDQVTVRADVTIVYHVSPDQAARLLRTVGTTYESIIVRPTSRELVRTVGTRYAAVDLVTSKRAEFAAEVKDELSVRVGRRGLIIDEVQIRDMALPETLQAAVNDKAAAAQVAEKKLNELRQAQLDGDIERTKAQATADAQQIVACGATVGTVTVDGIEKQVPVPNRGDACDQRQLSPEYLQYAYIQSLKGLVDSPNNSTVILPFDQNLTPLLNLPAGNGAAAKPGG